MTPTHPIIDIGATDAPEVNLNEIQSRVAGLADRVRSGELGRTEPWRGADVVVTPEYIPIEPNGFYPDDDQLITEHVAEVSWAFYELRDAFSSFLTSESKYWFFGTLRQAGMLGIEVQRPSSSEDARITVEFMVRAAEAMLESIRHAEETA
jgi:hypothetical protein